MDTWSNQYHMDSKPGLLNAFKEIMSVEFLRKEIHFKLSSVGEKI